MSTKKRKNTKYNDRISSDSLLSLSEVRNIFKDYNHDKQERFQKNLTLHDIGCIFYLIYLKRKYNCIVSPTEKEIKELPLKKDDHILNWLEELDFYVDEETHPKFLIYFKNKEFFYDPGIIQKTKSLQIHMVSHTFPLGSGHIGALLIENNKCYYFDSNGMKDKDDEEYYDCFVQSLTKEMKKYQIEYVPYQWKRGLQCYQESENDRYKVEMIGMCCSWSFFILELKLMNPNLSLEEIELCIKKKYRNRLTRMISTYQQEIHQILWKIANEIYFS